jgi:hypothetical protein
MAAVDVGMLALARVEAAPAAPAALGVVVLVGV